MVARIVGAMMLAWAAFTSGAAGDPGPTTGARPTDSQAGRDQPAPDRSSDGAGKSDVPDDEELIRNLDLIEQLELIDAIDVLDALGETDTEEEAF